MIDLSPETELLALRVAAAQHVTIDDAVREALEASAQTVGVAVSSRDTSPEAIATRRERAARFIEALAGMPVLDNRPIQEIVDDLNDV